MDSANEEPAALSLVQTGGSSSLPAAQEDKPAIDVNTMSQAPNLKFPVPEFYSEDPELWFWQLEATFQVNRVTTEKDKYAGVVSNLPFKVFQCIRRAIASEKEPYTVLKELVVKETDLSDYLCSEKLHALPMLGVQHPSELLASIHNLPLVQDCKCYCARYQFLSRMPPITRAQLVNQKNLTVDKLAALVDMIMLSQANLHNLMAEVDADRHNSEVLTVRQKKTRVKTETCWFHIKFGRDAKSCRQPCSWTGNG